MVLSEAAVAGVKIAAELRLGRDEKCLQLVIGDRNVSVEKPQFHSQTIAFHK